MTAKGTLSEHRECEICHRVRDVFVASSAFGPLSQAMCQECLQRPAESFFMFNHLYDDVAGGDPTKLDQSIRKWYTWIDGRYIHWDNFVIMKKEGKLNVA